MKKNVKLLLTAVLMGTLFLGISGCGKKEKEETEVQGEVYVPEYDQLAFDGGYISGSAIAGDTAFFYVNDYDEETDTSTNCLYKYDLLENKAEKLSYETGENSYINGMTIDGNGNLVFIVNCYDYTMDENGEITDEKNVMELCTVSADDGSIIDSRDAMELFGGREDVYIRYMQTDIQGNFYLWDGDSTIYVVNKEFQKVCDITVEGWIDNMVTSKEGDVYVSAYGEAGMELKKVDISAKKLGEPVSGLGEGYGNFGFYPGTNESLLVRNNDQISTFDLQSGTLTELFHWLDVDVDANNVEYAGELSDGRIWALTRDWQSSGDDVYELIFLSKKDASEVQEKEEIILGTLWLNSDFRKNIINFNKQSTQYRIRVKEYANDDYETGKTQFNTDLTTGNCPDIIDLSSLDFEQYASKGVLEDLYPFMEESGIKKEDYLENILRAYESDGKLYGIIPGFYISTIMAKTSLVGNINGWTLSEMLDFVEEQNPENVFAYGNRSSIFYYCIYNNIDEFIDWESGKCSFDGEEFIRTLEFAAKFPEEPDYNSEEREGTAARLHADKILLMDQGLTSVQEYQMMNGMFGEPVSYVGYPNSERKGNLIYPTSGSIGMAAKSKHKEGAWEFMKTVLSDEYQDSMVNEHGGYGFPLKKSSLEKQFELDMTPDYYEDEEGNKIENPKTTWGYDDFSMEIMAATQEEIDAVKALITSAEKISGNANEQLVNIITEEAEPFFKGQKSAADAAGIIQNRIQIYVNENR